MIWINQKDYDYDKQRILQKILHEWEGVSCCETSCEKPVFKENEYVAGAVFLQPQYRIYLSGASCFRALIRTKGERALFDLNRASLLYDMRKFREAADILLEIPPVNPQFDAQCAQMKTKIMEAM